MAREIILKFLLLLLIGLMPLAARAETNTVVIPFVCNTYPCSPPAKWPTFDDRIFNLESKDAPTTSTAPSGKTRSLGQDKDYNYQQRETWMKQCAPLQFEGMRRFRECFEKERSEAAAERERRQDEINRQRNAPYRNVPPRGELGASNKKFPSLLAHKKKNLKR